MAERPIILAEQDGDEFTFLTPEGDVQLWEADFVVHFGDYQAERRARYEFQEFIIRIYGVSPMFEAGSCMS